MAAMIQKTPQDSAKATYAAAYRRFIEARCDVDAATCGRAAWSRSLVIERRAAVERARIELHLARKAAKAAGVSVGELTEIEIGDRPSHMLL